MDARKQEEISFHDALRRDAYEQRWSVEAEARMAPDPLWANFKYYSVERKSLEYLRNRLSQHAPGKTVLDFGCGNGEESLFVARHGARRVVGIDLSEVSIENCRQRAHSEDLDGIVEFRIGDVEALDFEDNTFDLAMEYGVLHHVDLDAAMRELARVVRPGGAVICTEALGHNPAIQLYRRLTPSLRTKWEVEHIIRRHHFRTMRKYFETIDIRFFHLATLAAVPFRKCRWFGRLLASLETVDALLLKAPLLKWHAWECVFVLSAPKK